MLLLGVQDDEQINNIISAYASLLQLIGKRLLPMSAGAPADRLVRARSDVQELAFLLASLSDRAAVSCNEPKLPTLDGSSALSPMTVDPLQSMDPWKMLSKGKGKGKDKGKETATSSLQTVQCITVENVVEAPAAKPLTCDASTFTMVERRDVSTETDAKAPDCNRATETHAKQVNETSVQTMSPPAASCAAWHAKVGPPSRVHVGSVLVAMRQHSSAENHNTLDIVPGSPCIVVGFDEDGDIMANFAQTTADENKLVGRTVCLFADDVKKHYKHVCLPRG